MNICLFFSHIRLIFDVIKHINNTISHLKTLNDYYSNNLITFDSLKFKNTKIKDNLSNELNINMIYLNVLLI